MGWRRPLARAVCLPIVPAGLADGTMLKTAQTLIVAMAALTAVSCSKPQSVSDLKAAIVSLRAAGQQDNISEERYHGLLADARAHFAAAKDKLSGDAAAACGQALDRAGDVELVWTDTEGIADGLTPVVEAPLQRLGVVKNQAEFDKRAAGFIWMQESPDDDTAEEAAAKEQARDQARHDLIREAMDAVNPALVKAEGSL